MPARNRLSRSDFQNLQGIQRLNGALFSLSHGTISTRKYPGVACVISAKIARKASDRAKIRRWVRSILRTRVHSFAPGVALVFVAKKGVLTASFAEVVHDLDTLLRRV